MARTPGTSVRFVEQLHLGVRTLRQDVFLDRVERQYANIRAALDWCQAHGYAEASLRLAVGLFWFWSVRGYLTEGRARLEALLTRFPLRSTAGSERAFTLRLWLQSAIWQLRKGISRLVPNTRIKPWRSSRHLDDPEGVIAAVRVLAVIAQKRNDLDAATHYLEQSLASIRLQNAAAATPESVALMALTLSNLGRVAHERGDEAEAGAQFEEAERLIETLTDRPGAGLIKLGLAEAARDTNDHERAQALAESALEILEHGATNAAWRWHSPTSGALPQRAANSHPPTNFSSQSAAQLRNE